MSTAASNLTPPPPGEVPREVDALARAVAAEVIAQLERLGLAGEQPALIDAAGFARMLGVSLKTLERLDQTGKVPQALSLTRVRRWLRAEIDAWLLAGAPARDRWAAMRKAGAVRLGHVAGHGLKVVVQK